MFTYRNTFACYVTELVVINSMSMFLFSAYLAVVATPCLMLAVPMSTLWTKHGSRQAGCYTCCSEVHGLGKAGCSYMCLIKTFLLKLIFIRADASC